jgi:hypothetical protein
MTGGIVRKPNQGVFLAHTWSGFMVMFGVIQILKETSIPVINIKMPKRLSRKP